MTQLLVWALEALLLAIAFYVFLRFVRRTRGSRLVRGLATALMLGALTLWALTEALELDELRHILESVTGYAVIVLAIVFQPELRRAVSQLGDNKFSSAGAVRLATGTVTELAQAAREMSTRRQGALVAIECETPLDTYVESGVRVDAPVSRMLLESIFHPGGALHDGAVIVRGDRIAAALCLFPLTESRQIQRSTGTRHRAALGITEETDAVALVVSEETGLVSICRRGQMRAGVPHDEIERALASALGAEEGVGTPRRPVERTVLGRLRASGELVRRDAAWMAFAGVLGMVVVALAWRDLITDEVRTLALVSVPPSSTRAPEPGDLIVRLPAEDYELVAGSSPEAVQVEVSGTRGQLERLGADLAGELRLADTGPGLVALDDSDVRWRGLTPGVRLAWADDAPTLRVDRIGTRQLDLGPQHLDVETKDLDARFTLALDRVEFTPPVVELRGPAGVLARIDAGEIPMKLARISVSGTGVDGMAVHRVGLPDGLSDLGVTLVGPAMINERLEVRIPVVPAERNLEGLTREVALVCLDPARRDELARWTLPAHAQTARFSISTRGLIPATLATGEPAMLERATTIRHFVEQNLSVYVDIADLADDGSERSVPVRWTWRSDWRKDLATALAIDPATISGYEQLEVRLDSEADVLLEPIE